MHSQVLLKRLISKHTVKHQLVTEPMRGEMILDLILSGTRDLAHDVKMSELIAKGAIRFNISVGGKLTRKLSTVKFNFFKKKENGQK